MYLGTLASMSVQLVKLEVWKNKFFSELKKRGAHAIVAPNLAPSPYNKDELVLGIGVRGPAVHIV